MKNKTILKPWGKYVILEKTSDYWVKKLFIRQGESLSLQSHQQRREFWVVLSGAVQAIKGKAKCKLGIGEFLKINKKEKHRITGLADSWILEIALDKPRERDIIRFKDQYGRIK
jgi:mannose-6-phosphate isomerase-like protein (cupin superfamily)